MRTVISNDIRIYDPSSELMDWARSNLTVPNPNYQTMIKLKKDDIARRMSPTLDLYIERSFPTNALILPFGCLTAIWKYIDKTHYTTEFNGPVKVLN